MTLRDDFIHSIQTQLVSENLPKTMENYLVGIDFEIIMQLAEREMATSMIEGYRSHESNDRIINEYNMLAGLKEYNQHKKTGEPLKQPLLPTPAQKMILKPLVEQAMLRIKYDRINQRYDSEDDSVESFGKFNLAKITELNEEQKRNVLLNPDFVEYFNITGQCESSSAYLASILSSGALLHTIQTVTKDIEARLSPAELQKAAREGSFSNISVTMPQGETIRYGDVIATHDKALGGFINAVHQSEGAKKADQFRLAGLMQIYKDAITQAIQTAETKHAKKQVAILKTHFDQVNELQNHVLSLPSDSLEMSAQIKKHAEDLIGMGDKLKEDLKNEGYPNALSRAFNGLKRGLGSLFGIKVAAKFTKKDAKPLLQFSTSKKQPAGVNFGNTFQHLIEAEFAPLRKEPLSELEQRTNRLHAATKPKRK